MSIRISKTVDSDTTVLHVAGGLDSEKEIDVLSEEFRRIGGSVTLELSGLQSANSDGIAILREIAAMGAELRAPSPYIRLLLKQGP